MRSRFFVKHGAPALFPPHMLQLSCVNNGSNEDTQMATGGNYFLRLALFDNFAAVFLTTLIAVFLTILFVVFLVCFFPAFVTFLAAFFAGFRAGRFFSSRFSISSMTAFSMRLARLTSFLDMFFVVIFFRSRETG